MEAMTEEEIRENNRAIDQFILSHGGRIQRDWTPWRMDYPKLFRSLTPHEQATIIAIADRERARQAALD